MQHIFRSTTKDSCTVEERRAIKNNNVSTTKEAAIFVSLHTTFEVNPYPPGFRVYRDELKIITPGLLTSQSYSVVIFTVS